MKGEYFFQASSWCLCLHYSTASPVTIQINTYIYCIYAHITFPLLCHCHSSTSLSTFFTSIPFFSPFPFLASPTSLIRSLSTGPHVSESIRAESRRGRSFTEVNIKLHQTPRRKKRRERRGEREPSVPNPPHRSGGDEGNILF